MHTNYAHRNTEFGYEMKTNLYLKKVTYHLIHIWYIKLQHMNTYYAQIYAEFGNDEKYFFTENNISLYAYMIHKCIHITPREMPHLVMKWQQIHIYIKKLSRFAYDT